MELLFEGAWRLSTKYRDCSEVSLFQEENGMYLHKVWTQSSVLINQRALISGVLFNRLYAIDAYKRHYVKLR